MMDMKELNELGKRVSLLKKETDDLLTSITKLFNVTSDKILKVHKDKEVCTNKHTAIQDFCKERRVWAAKDMDGRWRTFPTRPTYRDESWYVDMDWYTKGDFSVENSICGTLYVGGVPDVSPEKSLIAPDGRLILIEGKKKKKEKLCVFKPGCYYRHKADGAVIIWGERVLVNSLYRFPRVQFEFIDPKWGIKRCSPHEINPKDWYEVNPPKKSKPNLKRGDPVFVWDDSSPDTIPASVKYLYEIYKNWAVMTFSEDEEGAQGVWYRRYRKFDPKLVGVPRKDWPKEK